MGNINFSSVSGSDNALAMVDSRYPNRWIDCQGASVQRYVFEETYRAGDFTITAGGTSPITQSLVAGSVALITTGATEYNGDNIQAVGTKFQLASGKPLYFGAKLTLGEATQTDLVVGLFGIDTTLALGSSSHASGVAASGIGFFKFDEATACTFRTVQTATETNTVSASTMDTNAHIYEFFYDGTNATAYVDGVRIGCVTSGLPTVVLTPSIAFQTGSANARTCTVHWMKCFQVNA
jgi:hypothetical protein